MPERGDATAPGGALEHVFTPVRIGALELPHRIVMGSMHLGVEAADDAGPRLAAFYRERALGGAGLIVTGGWAVSPDGAADHSYGLLGPGTTRSGRPKARGSERGRLKARPPGQRTTAPPGEPAKRALAEVAASTEGTDAAIALQLFHSGRYALADSPGHAHWARICSDAAGTRRISGTM